MSHSNVALLVAKGTWLKKSFLGKFDLTHCLSEERVCHATREDEGGFIYMYETAFSDLGVVLPFDWFTVDVLWMLEVSTSQLHPNGWAAMQAFRVIFILCPSYPLPPFSLAITPPESVKMPVGFPSHHSPRGASSLPTRLLTRGLSMRQLSFDDWASIRLLDELPRGLSCQDLVVASFSHQSIAFLKEMLHKRGYDISTNEEIDFNFQGQVGFSRGYLPWHRWFKGGHYNAF
ncbi:hypothetical protein CR513_36721, partial [Mucuna pruriens]